MEAKQVFENVVKHLNKKEGYYFHKSTWTEDRLLITFSNSNNNRSLHKDIWLEAKANANTVVEYGTDAYYKLRSLLGNGQCVKDFIHVNFQAGKVSIKKSSLIYGFVNLKNSQKFKLVYYAQVKNILTVTDKAYVFIYQRKPNSRYKKRNVRLATNKLIFNHEHHDLIKEALGLKVVSDSLPYYIGKYENKSKWEVMEEDFGVKIPKSLRSYHVNEVYKVLKALKNKNQINTLAQTVSWYKDKYNEKPNTIYDVVLRTLFPTGIGMNGNQAEEVNSWLIRDWINDHAELNKKFSLNVSSLKRIIDEHNKMSIEIRLKGIKDVKVHSKFKKLKDAPEGITLIQDKETLLAEGVEMQHCVASYANRINAGECAILSYSKEGKRCTAEIHMYGDKFRINQIRSYRNSNPETSVAQEIINWVRSLNGSDEVLVNSHTSIELPF